MGFFSEFIGGFIDGFLEGSKDDTNRSVGEKVRDWLDDDDD